MCTMSAEDLRRDLDAQPDEGAPVNLLAAVRMKFTIDADGNWIERPASEIDGDHSLARASQCDLTVTQEPETADV
jgi:hypothetical protein